MVQKAFEPGIEGEFLTIVLLLLLVVYHLGVDTFLVACLVLELIEEVWKLLQGDIFWRTLVENLGGWVYLRDLLRLLWNLLRRSLQVMILSWLWPIVLQAVWKAEALHIVLSATVLWKGVTVYIIDWVLTLGLFVIWTSICLHWLCCMHHLLSVALAISKTTSSDPSLIILVKVLLLSLLLLHTHWEYILSNITYHFPLGKLLGVHCVIWTFH